MNETIEDLVLQNLMNSDAYYSKAYSHLDKGLFQNPNNSVIFETIQDLTNKYNKRPSPQEVGLAIKQDLSLNKTLQSTTISKFKDVLREPPVQNMDFLIDKTQTWVQRIKLSKTIFEAADIIQNDGSFDPIPGMVEDSLNINFDTSIGLDYGESIEERLEYYKSRETYTATGLKTLDYALGGGIRPASLFLLASSSHGGKTMLKSFLSANLLLKKKNVLFITLEMPEKEIAKRIDANIMGTTINDLSELSEKDLMTKWDNVKDNIGQLVIKEYGAGTFNTMHLKSLLDELKSKKNFIPDAIVIDYLGLMTSARADSKSNSYEMLGKVAEDLHAMSKETYDSKGNKGVMMISSSQLNRSSYGNTESGMEAVSESLKIMMTADVAINLISNDQMREQNQQIFKIIKNRYTGQMSSLMMETNFPRVHYSPLDDGNSYDAVDQEELNTGAPVQPDKNDFDFGQLQF